MLCPILQSLRRFARKNGKLPQVTVGVQHWSGLFCVGVLCRPMKTTINMVYNTTKCGKKSTEYLKPLQKIYIAFFKECSKSLYSNMTLDSSNSTTHTHTHLCFLPPLPAYRSLLHLFKCHISWGFT